MHSTRTCHKDIRPVNFYLQGSLSDISSIVPKIGYFGSEKEDYTYLAPEVRDANKIDEAADTWALGVTFYRMLSGKLPFEGSKEGPFKALPKYVGNDMSTLVFDMLNKDPSKRPEM